MTSQQPFDPWRPGSIRNAPYLAFLCLLASFATAAAAIFVVYYANGKEVDSWPLAPSVFLSILATLATMLLRAAFQTGVDTHWWALLLSRSGTKVHTLHNVWELGHDAAARFKFWSDDFQPVLRAAGIVILLLGANGPLLQRAVFVELEQTESLVEINLPIRQEPMWNLTTKLIRHEGFVWSPPPYQDEFAQVVNDLNQRRPMQMQSDGCPRNSTCKTTVNIASFSRVCVKSYAPFKGAPTLEEFQMILRGLNTPERCETTGLEDAEKPSGCDDLNLEYQLSLDFLDVDGFKSTGMASPSPGPDELPWLGPRLSPFGIQYTSYFKEDADSEMIAIRRCNFTTAFVNLPIEITEGSTVTLSRLTGPELARRNKGEESIPAFAKNPHMGSSGFHPFGGLRQTMSDLYGGFIFYDHSTASNMIRGIGPRQYINQSSIRPRPEGDGQNTRGSYSASIIDPVTDFTNTLHELSLRYAMQTIPSTSERLQEMDDYFDIMVSSEPGAADRIQEIRARLKTRPSTTQTTRAIETKRIAVYRVDYMYAAIAAGITCLATIMVAFLFTGWRRLGRKFSTSPVEIAKAFDAPLLAAVGSNATGEVIAKDHGSLRVRYGEKGDPGGVGLLAESARSSGRGWGKGWGSPDVGVSSVTGYPGAEGYGGNGGVRMRLVVDAAERISPPVKGRTYE
ncbi:hypothetical protein B0T11DRAFT_84031 [Plectosphaerella cucumerina]|uniref:Uncharacterized protein n=1 Tax=Plectosphaerella cucumerina TaxID=40658 RepID=A0A8K0THW4_9PEZI|nr:hypothetical protein B0T11DRAFT_84031 [Plectosphaerella cucumerina]